MAQLICSMTRMSKSNAICQSNQTQTNASNSNPAFEEQTLDANKNSVIMKFSYA